MAVVTDTIEIEVVACVKTTDAQAVETGVGAAADVGDATECGAQVVGAVIDNVGGLDRVDGLRHVAHRRVGAGRRIRFLHTWVIGLGFGADGGGR
ncbi:hypothetical protein D3C84_1021170 [compost metagenome]